MALVTMLVMATMLAMVAMAMVAMVAMAMVTMPAMTMVAKAMVTELMMTGARMSVTVSHCVTPTNNNVRSQILSSSAFPYCSSAVPVMKTAIE